MVYTLIKKSSLRIWIAVVFCAVIQDVYGQRVTVSPDIDTRSLKSYEMLGSVKDNFLLYTRDGRKDIIHGFDKNLASLYERELNLDGEKRMDIYTIALLDTTLVVYYGRKKNKDFTMYGSVYDQNVRKIKTDTIYDQVQMKFRVPSYAHSEDRAYTLLYFPFKKEYLRLLLLDNATGSLVWNEVVQNTEYNFSSDLLNVFVGSNKEVHLVVGDSDKSKNVHFDYIKVVDGKVQNIITTVMDEDTYPQDIHVSYNTVRGEIIYSGIYSNSRYSNPSGYFFSTIPVTGGMDNASVNYVKFDRSFMSDLYGIKLRKKKDLDQFVVRYVIPRLDGGFLLCIEKHHEYMRKDPFRSLSSFRDGRQALGGIDVYDEDIAIINVNPDGTELWKRILFKKQFSQDHNQVFSSFFMFTTDSRLRLIYNDEISKNNIVSEYVLNPLGDYERNSLFNTEYQHLKLRFQESIQVSSQVLIVPSEHATHLNLVKIDYASP